MLLNQDQDLLGDLSIAICSSSNIFAQFCTKDKLQFYTRPPAGYPLEDKETILSKSNYILTHQKESTLDYHTKSLHVLRELEEHVGAHPRSLDVLAQLVNSSQ